MAGSRCDIHRTPICAKQRLKQLGATLAKRGHAGRPAAVEGMEKGRQPPGENCRPKSRPNRLVDQAVSNVVETGLLRFRLCSRTAVQRRRIAAG